MGTYRGRYFYGWNYNHGRRQQMDFIDIQTKIARRKRARANGGFAQGRNTRINIYMARWPHTDDLVETYAVQLHSTEILYLCADATASYAFTHDSSKTTGTRLAAFQMRRPYHDDKQPRFFSGSLFVGRAEVIGLPRHPERKPPDLRNTVVVEHHKSAPCIWLPDGRRFWVRPDSDAVKDKVADLLDAMIDYAEPFTSALSRGQLAALHSRSLGWRTSTERLGMAVAAALDGNFKTALSKLVWKRDRADFVKRTGLADPVVQLITGLQTAREVKQNINTLNMRTKRVLGIMHLQNVDTGERVYGELDKPAPAMWLVPKVYGPVKAKIGTQKELAPA